MTSPGGADRSSARLAIALLAIAFATAAAYAPALGGGFHFDDREGIELNPRIRSLDAFLASAGPGWVTARPLTELTFALDVERAGLSPRAFHATSLGLHLGAVLLVFVFTRAVFRRAGAPGDAGGAGAAVAGAFALHPIQTEAVAYASQRAEVLASFLALATLVALLEAERARTAARAALIGAAAVVLHALALGAKMVAAVVPVLFVAIAAALPDEEDSPQRSHRLRRVVLLAAPLVALTVAQAAPFFETIQGAPDVGFSVPAYDPWRCLLTQVRVVPRYLGLLASPARQTLDHPVTASAGLLDPPAALAGAVSLSLLLLGAVAALVWTRARGATSPAAPAVRVAALGIVWFFVCLAPTSSLVPLDDAMVEHRLYLASLGPFAAAVAVVLHVVRPLSPSRRRALLGVVAMIAAVGLGLALRARASLWGDPIALWQDAAEKAPRSARPLLNVAAEHEERGEFSAAYEASARALAVAGRRQMEAAMQGMASALLGAGRATEARAVLARVPAPNPETVVLLTFAELDLGDVDRAERHAIDLVTRAGSYPRSHEAMGRVLAARGKLPGARAALRRVVALAPAAEPLRRLGAVELALGDRAAGCAALAEAARSADSAWSAVVRPTMRGRPDAAGAREASLRSR